MIERTGGVNEENAERMLVGVNEENAKKRVLVGV